MIDKALLFRLFEESTGKYNKSLHKRAIFEDAKKYLSYKEALVLTGVRRCGKTSLMYALMQHLDSHEPEASKVYINFEDERLIGLEPKDMETFFEYYLEYAQPTNKVYFFLDEIQNIPAWEKVITRLYETYKFVLSGSNANVLSSDLASALTGRHKEIRVYPFRFAEFCDTKKTITREQVAAVRSNFEIYLQRGGFPESLLYNKTDLLQDYYKNILFKDVIGRHNIKYKDLLQKLSAFMFSNCSKQISFYALEKRYDAGINTIRNYVSYLESSFLLESISIYSNSVKKQQGNPLKYYAVDIALAQSVAFHFSEDVGRVLENIIANELIARGNELYYHKAKGECDFIVKKGITVTEAIQVCHTLNDNNEKREFTGLLEACKTYKLTKGIIITNDQEKTIRVEDIEIIILPAWKWLLE
ncbi:MAG: ATP-binding protein [Candidatus Woesearchaeota archaeon]